jgi:hypothetical protein
MRKAATTGIPTAPFMALPERRSLAWKGGARNAPQNAGLSASILEFEEHST